MWTAVSDAFAVFAHSNCIVVGVYVLFRPGTRKMETMSETSFEDSADDHRSTSLVAVVNPPDDFLFVGGRYLPPSLLPSAIVSSFLP